MGRRVDEHRAGLGPQDIPRPQVAVQARRRLVVVELPVAEPIRHRLEDPTSGPSPQSPRPSQPHGMPNPLLPEEDSPRWRRVERQGQRIVSRPQEAGPGPPLRCHSVCPGPRPVRHREPASEVFRLCGCRLTGRKPLQVEVTITDLQDLDHPDTPCRCGLREPAQAGGLPGGIITRRR